MSSPVRARPRAEGVGLAASGSTGVCDGTLSAGRPDIVGRNRADLSGISRLGIKADIKEGVGRHSGPRGADFCGSKVIDGPEPLLGDIAHLPQ